MTKARKPTSAARKLSAQQWRRRHKLGKVAAMVGVGLILSLLLLGDRAGMFGRRAQPDRQKYHGKTFAVVRVIDGDTLDVAEADGKRPHTRIRLWGVDTPETKKPDTPVQHFGPEATQFTRSLCRNQRVRIELEPEGRTRDKYKRLLAWVYLPDGRLLNALLIEQGYGYADPRFDNHLKGELRQLQDRAKRDSLGLWKDVRQRDLPHYLRRKSR